MNAIENKTSVGSPGSLARYQYAHRICADCLERSKSIPQLASVSQPYKVLTANGNPLVFVGTCYVCELKTLVAAVEYIGPTLL